MQRGEMAQAGGWLARGARLAEESGYDGVEPGYLLIPQALQSLMAGRAADAFGIFQQVAAIAERFDDADLRTMGRLGRGQSLIAMAETRRGVALLDEAMTAVIAGEISPIASESSTAQSSRPASPCSTSGVRRSGPRHWNAGGNRSPTLCRSVALPGLPR